MTDRIALTRRFNLGAAALAFGAAALLGATAHAATITETWDGDETGNADSWPSQWTHSGDTAGTDVSIEENGGTVRQASPVSTAKHVVSLINTTTFTDSVQTVEISAYDSAFLRGGLVARFNEGEGGDTYYWARIQKPNANDPFHIQIVKVVNGSTSSLAGSTNIAISSTEYSEMSFSVQTVGSAVSLKMTYTDFDGVNTTKSWLDQESPLLDAGQVGLRSDVHSNSARFIRYDNYSAAIPEPGTLALGLMGLGLMTLPRRQQRA